MGLAVNGCEEEAIELFSRLESSKFIPDGVSFLGVLTSCNHFGMVEKARHYFSKMTRIYKIEPSIEHYSSMVDVLGRAGLLEDAEELIDNMPEAIKERLSMKEQKIEKEPGCSLIEVDGEVHEFIAGGRLHQKAPEIYSLLDELGFMMPEME
ncbi:hypothetical protein C1H46_042374 [Malus baccata]|uniref:DYW domain-containing protein n=1 Tax=Malus baccata TaxID=106549 RepID=A0A540KCX9_MALBA|nr:hypothetical protein C1H46_042374 [Malus baccata]